LIHYVSVLSQTVIQADPIGTSDTQCNMIEIHASYCIAFTRLYTS